MNQAPQICGTKRPKTQRSGISSRRLKLKFLSSCWTFYWSIGLSLLLKFFMRAKSANFNSRNVLHLCTSITTDRVVLQFSLPRKVGKRRGKRSLPRQRLPRSSMESVRKKCPRSRCVWQMNVFNEYIIYAISMNISYRTAYEQTWMTSIDVIFHSMSTLLWQSY